MKDEAEVVITDQVIMSLNEAYEGALIYQTTRSILSINNDVKMRVNTIYRRALIMSLEGSSFNITNVLVEKNRANLDTLFIFASDTREQYHLIDKSVYKTVQFF